MALTKVIGSGIGTVTNQFADANMSAGSVLQVKQAVKTDTQTTTASDFADVTDLSVSITPSSASSKILVYSNVLCVGTVGAAGAWTRIVRDSTAIGVADAASNRIRALLMLEVSV